ncbi:flippase [Oceanobacillus longus]|uniref:Flippase n=1 Tax=Oceanobacillus longus TaxID=930120 RepID=A0ABV8H2Q2_9BACI
MKKNSTAFQLITSIGTKVFVLFGSFIISIITARFLGPEGKGIVTAIFVIPNLLVSIADLGIRQATAYYVGKKIYNPTKVYSSILLMWVATSITSILIAVIYYLTGPSEQYGWLLLTIPIATIPFMLLNKYIEGLFSGLQQVNAINIKNLIGFFVNLITICILVVFLGLGIYGASIATMLTALITMLFSVIIIKRFVIIEFKYEKGIAKSLVSKGIIYAIALFVLNLNYKIDIIFLERLTTPTDVGIYSIGVSLSELIWQIPAAMGMVLFSKSANSKLENEAVNRSTKLLRISWIPVITLSLCFWFLAPHIIEMLYGNDFIQSVSVIRLLLPGVIAMVVFKILNADLAGRGYPLFALRVYLFALVINMILNFTLIPNFGIEGAAVASTISYTIGALLFSLEYTKQSNIKYSDLFIMKNSDIKLIMSSLYKILDKLKRRR